MITSILPMALIGAGRQWKRNTGIVVGLGVGLWLFLMLLGGYHALGERDERSA